MEAQDSMTRGLQARERGMTIVLLCLPLKTWEQGAQWGKPWPDPGVLDVQREKKMDTSAQSESEFSLPLPFYSLQALEQLDDDTHDMGEDGLLHSVYQFGC